MWDRQASYHCLALKDVRIEVRLGVHQEERLAPQPVSVDVELYLHADAFTAVTLDDCLDYSRIFRHLTQVWPQRPHVDLLEQLAEDLIDVCLQDARVEACRVVIRKLAIYGGRAVPEITVYRQRRT